VENRFISGAESSVSVNNASILLSINPELPKTRLFPEPQKRLQTAGHGPPGASKRALRCNLIWQATCNFAVMQCESAFEMQTQATNSDLRMDVSGEQSAVLEMKEVLARRLPFLYRCAWRLLGNAADAEDAVQEALLAAYRHIDQFRGQSQMSTWLTTIVRNCALMQLRKRPRQIHLPLDAQTGGEGKQFVWERLADRRPSPEEECRNLELSALLQQCAVRLSPTLRRTFQLRVLRGLSIFETARILGLPHGTVKAQLARARKSIARHMRPALAPRSRGPYRAH
jgi:RNA polymerase sigma-70 factor (ECF subfamily)